MATFSSSKGRVVPTAKSFARPILNRADGSGRTDGIAERNDPMSAREALPTHAKAARVEMKAFRVMPLFGKFTCSDDMFVFPFR